MTPRRFAEAPQIRFQPAIAGPPPPSGLRPATEEERRSLDVVLTSLSGLINRAKEDLPNANESDERRRFSTDVQRELVLDVERLGPLPDVFGIDNYYRHAHLAATAAIGNLRTLAGLGAGAPTSSREYLIKKADEQLDKARDHVKHMQPVR